MILHVIYYTITSTQLTSDFTLTTMMVCVFLKKITVSVKIAFFRVVFKTHVVQVIYKWSNRCINIYCRFESVCDYKCSRKIDLFRTIRRWDARGTAGKRKMTTRLSWKTNTKKWSSTTSGRISKWCRCGSTPARNGAECVRRLRKCRIRGNANPDGYACFIIAREISGDTYLDVNGPTRLWFGSIFQCRSLTTGKLIWTRVKNLSQSTTNRFYLLKSYLFD